MFHNGITFIKFLMLYKMKKAVSQAKIKMHWWKHQRQVQQYGRHGVQILSNAVPNFGLV